MIQTSKAFKVSSDDAGDYAGSLQRDETVSGWEDLAGDPAIRLGDRVLLCRHRWIRGHGFDWLDLYNDRENLVNRVVRIVRRQDLSEETIGYIQVQLEESYGPYGDKSKDCRQTWWRTRDTVKLWPATFTVCYECGVRIDVPLKTPYFVEPRLCTGCSSQKPPKGPIDAVVAQTSGDGLMIEQEFCKPFDRAGRTNPRTRAELKAKIKELQGRLDELGPEENLVDVSDLSDWISKPMGVPRIPKKYKVEL